MIADQQVFLVPLTRDLCAQGEASSDTTILQQVIHN